jgi:epoxyqueuosine reductase QueG
MGSPDISNAERPVRVRVGGVDVKRMAEFRRRFPPAAKRHLYIRDELMFPHREPPANPNAPAIDDPAKVTEELKQMAREMGAQAVGVADFDPRFTFAQVDEFEHRTVIVFAMAMEYDFMADIGPRSQDEVHRVYYRLDDIGMRLAQHIAAWGYTARMQPNAGDFPLPAYGWLAGLGELGKHGSLISPELGSSFRLCAVSTDMKLVADGPCDAGIDETCANCKMCTRFCPGDAIKPDKQTVNGIERWIVEREACEPYFHKLYGCKICLMVCPLNARGMFRDAYKQLSRDLVKAKDADGMLALIDQRTELKYGEFEAALDDEKSTKDEP